MDDWVEKLFLRVLLPLGILGVLFCLITAARACVRETSRAARIETRCKVAGGKLIDLYDRRRFGLCKRRGELLLFFEKDGQLYSGEIQKVVDE